MTLGIGSAIRIHVFGCLWTTVRGKVRWRVPLFSFFVKLMQRRVGMPTLGNAARDRASSVAAAGPSRLKSFMEPTVEVRIDTPDDLELGDPNEAQERLFAIGDEIAARTKMTREDIRVACADHGKDMTVGQLRLKTGILAKPSRWKQS